MKTKHLFTFCLLLLATPAFAQVAHYVTDPNTGEKDHIVLEPDGVFYIVATNPNTNTSWNTMIVPGNARYNYFSHLYYSGYYGHLYYYNPFYYNDNNFGYMTRPILFNRGAK